MIEMTIPGRDIIRIEHLVCDVNGTLAVDGNLIHGVAEKFLNLREHVQIHLVTADTHGRQVEIDTRLNLNAIRIRPGDEAGQKLAILQKLGASSCAAIGQGANDVLMLKGAALGICVVSDEGTCAAALSACDILARDIITALELFEKPQRIQATLRQ
jgi:soluble P-type ATPase